MHVIIYSAWYNVYVYYVALLSIAYKEIANNDWVCLLFVFTAVDCGAPEAITNGKVTYSTTEYRAKSQYNCDACYKLEGVATRTCKQSGIWSKENPKCAREGMP